MPKHCFFNGGLWEYSKEFQVMECVGTSNTFLFSLSIDYSTKENYAQARWMFAEMHQTQKWNLCYNYRNKTPSACLGRYAEIAAELAV